MHKPPVAEQRPFVHREHGRGRSDPYHWMRKRSDPAVVAYIEAENAWTKQRLAPLEDLRSRLFEEMLGRVQETDESAAVPDGPWEYYRRTEQGRPYGIFCRRPRGGGQEQILLDVNVFDADHDYVDVRGVHTSPDHRLLSYGIDTTGREVYEVRVVDLETGEIVDSIPEAAATVTWAADSAAFLWRELDPALRPHRVRLRTLGGGQGEDPLVYEEPDERFRVGTGTTRSREYIVVGSFSSMSTELHLVPAAAPDTPPRCLQPRQRKLRYQVEHRGDELWIVTDDHVGPNGEQTDDAVNNRLVVAPVTATSREAWVEVLPHRAHVELVSVDAFANHLVLTEREEGQLRLRVRDLRTGDDHFVELPEAVCVVSVGENLELDTPWLRLVYGSMTTPVSVFRYHMDTRELVLEKQTPVPGYDRTKYTTTRRWASAADGARIPISIVHRADLDIGPATPLLLHGYGAYGITMEPDFSVTRVSLLDRGVVFATAHVRGGGFLGRPWYEAGKLELKERSFSDFAACARHLHDAGVSSPERTVIMGGSAGGLLMGAVLNRTPEICRGALAAVPFVDIVTTMLDASLPLTAGEWDEWGDPREQVAFETMLSYSPYDNVQARPYPDLLIISGLNDPRVQYWEPTKWLARLRATATGGEFLMKTHMGAGHAGASGRYGFLEDKAFEYAWILDQLRAI